MSKWEIDIKAFIFWKEGRRNYSDAWYLSACQRYIRYGP
jgi:hypothetical protein